MRYMLESATSWAYWRYVLFSATGIKSILAVLGGMYLIVEILDFFKVYTRDDYASFAFLIFLLLASVIAIACKRPISSVTIGFPKQDYEIEVRIGNIFDAAGAVMISTNTVFECDVATGKISTDSLQGQFTAKYYTGNQDELIGEIQSGLKELGQPPYAMGATVPVNTHGKTFYFTAMATLNEKGTASSTASAIKQALSGLWDYVANAGELQELAVPVIGTGRGRLQESRNKMIELIAESFVDASKDKKITDRLVIVVRPDDARRFQINLYEIKDRLRHTLLG